MDYRNRRCKGQCGVGSYLRTCSPNQFGFDGFEDGLDHGVIVTVYFATHRHGQTVSLQKPAIIVSAVLAAAARMVNEARLRLPYEDGLDQGIEGNQDNHDGCRLSS